MSKVTVTIEGEMVEVGQILRKMGELMESKQPTIVGDESEWTEERISKVWKDLSKNCKNVLREIARKNTNWEQLQENLGMTANEIGGSLSSLGRNLKKHGLNGITYPLKWDDETNGYFLLPIWKKIILLEIENIQ